MQFGFQKNKKTEDALAFLNDRIVNAINNDNKIITIFLDLAKAFDTVNHARLLKKLERYGIRGKANDLLTSYLSNRKQFVRINSVLSDKKTVLCGVPQCTILGPLLFILYVNDIFNILAPDEVIAFADDTAIIVEDDSWQTISANAEEKFNSVAKWLNLNQLSLNIGKTNFVTFGCYKNSLPPTCNIQMHENNCDKLFCECPNIDRVSYTKYLGVIIDCNLK